MAEPRRRAVFAVVAALVATPAVAVAQDEPAPPPPHTAQEYLSMWDDAVLPGLATPEPAVFDLFVGVTGNAETDTEIRELAVARGYERQPVPVDELVPVDGRYLQAPAAEAWSALRAAAGAAGVGLQLTSAHRSARDQRAVFLDRLVGVGESGILATLRFSAPPGFSRHHTGYAIDVGQPGSGRLGFGATRAYGWLAADDFAVPRSLGWIPSYPESGENMGPDPEPWELVWVGPGRIACARPVPHPSGFCDAAPSPHVDAITWLGARGVTVGCRPGRFCPDDPITRGDAASLIWRLHGAPNAAADAPFDDVFDDDPFAPAIDWLWSEGIAEGMTPALFGPHELLSADDALALVLRLAAAPGLPAPAGILAQGPDAPLPAPTGDLGAFISRGEFASILLSHATP